MKRDKNSVRKLRKVGRSSERSDDYLKSQVDFQTEHVLISLIDNNWTNIIEILSWNGATSVVEKFSKIPKNNENSLEFCMIELNENLNSFEIQ